MFPRCINAVKDRVSSDDVMEDSRGATAYREAEKGPSEGRTLGQRARVSHHVLSRQKAGPCRWSAGEGGG